MSDSNIKSKKLQKAIIFICFTVAFLLIMGIMSTTNSVNPLLSFHLTGASEKQAEKAYADWKQRYVVPVTTGMSRVVNPQDQAATVSEGMGYGLLFSAAMDDAETFEQLWNYVRNHLNENGLMEWKISRSGEVVGSGSASDADQDIAYALLLAAEKWPEHEDYLRGAKKMIAAIAHHEIAGNHLLLPGDGWGDDFKLNPSYISPAYYTAFQTVTGDSRWAEVSKANLLLLSQLAHPETGLLPDWVNNDRSIGAEQIFGYDAIRVPIRLLQYYNKTKDPEVFCILEKQYTTFACMRNNSLCAGYSLDGVPMAIYNNTAYLSSFLAVSLIEPRSEFSKNIREQLITADPSDYYGDSLKVWILLIAEGKL